MLITLIVTKTLRALLTLLLAMTFVFIALRLTGDPARIMLPPDVSEEMISQYREKYGLARPIYEQYFTYLQHLFQGDLGRSYIQGREVAQIIAERLPATLLLGGCTLLIMVVLGTALGVVAALNRGTFVDRLVMLIAAAGYSLPGFVVAVLMILLFSVTLRWLPTGGIGSPQHLIMPAIAGSVGGVGVLARFARSSVLEVAGRLHIRAARARGLPESRVVWRELLPNAAIPTITVIGFTLGGLVAGSVVIETVFSWPGVGQLLQRAVADRDLPVLQALILMIAFTMTLANLTVDLLYGWLDPRIADSVASNDK